MRQILNFLTVEVTADVFVAIFIKKNVCKSKKKRSTAESAYVVAWVNKHVVQIDVSQRGKKQSGSLLAVKSKEPIAVGSREGREGPARMYVTTKSERAKKREENE